MAVSREQWTVPPDEATKIPGRSWARILVQTARTIQQGHVGCEEPEEGYTARHGLSCQLNLGQRLQGHP